MALKYYLEKMVIHQANVKIGDILKVTNKVVKKSLFLKVEHISLTIVRGLIVGEQGDVFRIGNVFLEI